VRSIMSEEVKTWDHVLVALQTEPRRVNAVQGASGIEHEVLGIGVDDKTKRVVLVSAEHDARASALIQADVQATIPDAKVLIMRPVAINFNEIASRLSQTFGNVEFNFVEIGQNQEALKQLLHEKLTPVLDPFLGSLRQVRLQISNQIVGAVQQLAHFDFDSIAKGVISVRELLAVDFTQMDRNLGICYMPLYEFSGDDWELIASGADREAIKERLAKAGILQYFFPPMDQTALGFIDRGFGDPMRLREQLPLAPRLGHPFKGAEIVDPDVGVDDIIDALQDRGLIVEGEVGFEPSAEGDRLRWGVKFRPREGLLSKLITRTKLEINLSTKEWFGVTKK
jgi:hypothetical protein